MYTSPDMREMTLEEVLGLHAAGVAVPVDGDPFPMVQVRNGQPVIEESIGQNECGDEIYIVYPLG